MKQISYWAKGHVTYARIIVTCIKIILFVIAGYIGKNLIETGVNIPRGNFYIFFGATALFAALYYPRRQRLRKFSYVRQKCCDLLIIISSFMVVMTWSNNRGLGAGFATVSGSSFVEHPAKSSLSHKERKALRKQFFKQLKFMMAKSKDGKRSTNSGRLILAILAAVVLVALLVPLVCSLSCSGSDFLAILVAVAGLVGIFFLLKALLRWAKRG